MAAATYVGLLVASHLSEATPLTKDELAALLGTVAELSAITRQVRATVAAGQGKGQGAMLSVEAASQTLKVCQGLRDHVKALLVADPHRSGYPDCYPPEGCAVKVRGVTPRAQKSSKLQRLIDRLGVR